MSEFGEAIGGAVEGGLYARAVEPKAGAGGPAGEGACLNCGTDLLGSHCHACGQKAQVRRTISAFMRDLLHGALHFEGKMWHTLPLLAWRPGKLTRRYIDGERAKFVSPMALFLFSVFLMFAVFQLAGVSPPATVNGGQGVQVGVDQASEQLEQIRAEARSERDAIAQDDPERARIAELDEALAAIDGSADGVDAVNVRFTDARTGWPRLDRGIEKANENPGLALYKLQANSYKFSWLLIPLSLPFVWILFAWKRRFAMYDHAVFVTYSISFMSLLFITLTLLGFAGIPSNYLFVAGTLIPLWHIAKQMRGAYGLSRFSAIWRTVVMVWFIVIILTLFLLVLMLLGFIG